MIDVLVTGPESSGTSLVSKILRQAGANVFHRSATYKGDWPDLRSLALDCAYIVVVFRDPACTMKSQRDQGFLSWDKLQLGYNELFRALADIRKVIFVVTYEQLVLNPRSIDFVLVAMGLNPSAVTEQVRDENAKYYEKASV